MLQSMAVGTERFNVFGRVVLSVSVFVVGIELAVVLRHKPALLTNGLEVSAVGLLALAFVPTLPKNRSNPYPFLLQGTVRKL
jgi:hypothetical protein